MAVILADSASYVSLAVRDAPRSGPQISASVVHTCCKELILCKIAALLAYRLLDGMGDTRQPSAEYNSRCTVNIMIGIREFFASDVFPSEYLSIHYYIKYLFAGHVVVAVPFCGNGWLKAGSRFVL